jgi:hypothetical protein
MLNEEQQNTAVTITAGEVVVALQVISRLSSTGGLRDVELSPVGKARDGLVQAMETATGINFDQEKARQEALQRQRIAQAREAYAKQQEEATAEGATIEAPAEASEGDAPNGDASS